MNEETELEESLLDESHVIGLLRRFLGKADDTNENESHVAGTQRAPGRSDQAEAGCALWDLCVTEYHTAFLVKHGMISVIVLNLERNCRLVESDEQSSRNGASGTEDEAYLQWRIVEICFGILANISLHPTATAHLLRQRNLLPFLFRAFYFSNFPEPLVEACRALTGISRALKAGRADPGQSLRESVEVEMREPARDTRLQQGSKADYVDTETIKFWEEYLLYNDWHRRLLYILENSLEDSLLGRILELLFYLVFYFEDARTRFSTDLAAASLEVLHNILSDHDRRHHLAQVQVDDASGLEFGLRFLETICSTQAFDDQLQLCSGSNESDESDSSPSVAHSSRTLLASIVRELHKMIVLDEDRPEILSTAVIILSNLGETFLSEYFSDNKNFCNATKAETLGAPWGSKAVAVCRLIQQCVEILLSTGGDEGEDVTGCAVELLIVLFRVAHDHISKAPADDSHLDHVHNKQTWTEELSCLCSYVVKEQSAILYKMEDVNHETSNRRGLTIGLIRALRCFLEDYQRMTEREGERDSNQDDLHSLIGKLTHMERERACVSR